jgi:predicted ArsR family transcriptional regulator
MEVAVNDTIEPPIPSILTDEKLIASLKRRGPLTIEELSSESGMSWAQMFSSVDRLSRAGAVSLRRIGLVYQVAYKQAMRGQ